MEVINKSINEVVEQLKPLAEKALNYLKEYLKQHAEELLSKVNDEVTPVLEGMIKNLTGEMKGIAFGKEVEQLDLTTLVGFAKEHIVKNSNEIVVMRVKEEEASTYIYLAYSRNRELLPNNVNRYLIIKAHSLSPEVSDLFNESELIILK